MQTTNNQENREDTEKLICEGDGAAEGERQMPRKSPLKRLQEEMVLFM